MTDAKDADLLSLARQAVRAGVKSAMAACPDRFSPNAADQAASSVRVVRGRDNKAD